MDQTIDSKVVFCEEQRFRQRRLWGLVLSGLAVVIAVFGYGMVRMITEVGGDGLYIRFFPLTKRVILYKQIESCRSRTYRPLAEFGGWGIRWGWKSGKAYNVSGNRGVQVVLADGRKILIGSQRPDELADAINAQLTMTDHSNNRDANGKY